MIIYIEGPRNTGKSFLMSQIEDEQYRYPYLEGNIKPDSKDFLAGISMAKDLSLITLEPYMKTIVSDRGFLSSLVYGRIFKRYENIENDYIQVMNDYLRKIKYKIIIITGGCPIKDSARIKSTVDDPIYSELDYNLQLKLYEEIAEKFDNVIFFRNNCDDNSIKRFKKLIKETKNEHK